MPVKEALLKMDTMIDTTVKKTSTNTEIKAKLLELYDEIFAHNGYGEVRVDMRILHRGQKEVIIYCGKQYRFVVDFIRRKDSRPDGVNLRQEKNRKKQK